MSHAGIRDWVFRFLLFTPVVGGGISGAWAEHAAFDLAGPRVEMTVMFSYSDSAKPCPNR